MKKFKRIILGISVLLSLNINALDLKGFDKFGYNKNGYDIEGYNFFGYNKNGLNREGCNIYSYKNIKSLDCSVDKFAEEIKNNTNFLSYQLRRSKEILYEKG